MRIYLLLKEVEGKLLFEFFGFDQVVSHFRLDRDHTVERAEKRSNLVITRNLTDRNPVSLLDCLNMRDQIA